MTRSYEQRCVIARALDILGERWTLLILRELAMEPRRFGEILDALPGIGNSLLAARLKHLEANGVVRRTAVPGAGRVAAYELTDRGEALTPILAGLADWGAGLGDPPHGYTARAASRLTAMRLTASEEAARFDTLTQLEVGDEVFWMHGDGERVRLRRGPAPLAPGLRLTCADDTLTALAGGRETVDGAVEKGELGVEGELGRARRFFELFNLLSDER